MASTSRVAVSSEGMGAIWRVILAQKCQRQKEKQQSLIEVPRPMASYHSFPPVSPHCCLTAGKSSLALGTIGNGMVLYRLGTFYPFSPLRQTACIPNIPCAVKHDGGMW